jgi:hypothetical protein
MNRGLARELILHVDKGNLNSGNAPKNVAHWLEELGLPMGLLRFLQWNWVARDCELAHLRLYCMESIYGDDITKALLPYKLLQIGAAPNGDTLVADFSTESCRPGFVTHEEWHPGSREPMDPRQFFRPAARTFESLLYRIAEGLYVPTDYYAARDFNKFLEEERRDA